MYDLDSMYTEDKRGLLVFHSAFMQHVRSVRRSKPYKSLGWQARSWSPSLLVWTHGKMQSVPTCNQ